MGWTLPEYIGHPGYQYSPDGVPSMLFENTMDDTLQVAEIIPLKPQMEKNINLYRGENAWGDYVSYLGANEISPGKAEGKLKVVISQITPLTEQYNNEYGPSELASGLQNITSGSLQEIAFMNDFKGKSDLEKMSDEGGFKGAVAGMWNKAAEAGGKLAGGLMNSPELQQDVTQLLSNPTQKIDIPSMWKGNSFTSSYQITVRLYCFDPLNDKHFGDLILAPIGALLMFAVPKSEAGKFYTWPFMMDFKIPGQCHVPLGYCQSIDVVKGGDVSDISWIKRPGTVDLRMTVNTVFGVRVNAKSSSGNQRPTIIQELKTMYDMEETKQKSFANAISTSDASNSDKSWNDSNRTSETPEQAEAAVDAILSNV